MPTSVVHTPLPAALRATSARVETALPSEASSPGPADAVARGAPAANPARPSPAARELLRRLGAHTLRHTTARFPHVLEALARDWPEPHRMHATLDALLFDERGGRAGFPVEVMLELGDLRACYERCVAPRPSRGR